jgi:hypothetical protein
MAEGLAKARSRDKDTSRAVNRNRRIAAIELPELKSFSAGKHVPRRDELFLSKPDATVSDV